MRQMKYSKTFFIIIITALAFASCRREAYVTLKEPVKDIKGNWHIIAASRNGTDMFTRFDYSAFRLNILDSTYTIENQVPFIVSKSGLWRVDDPQYPFTISFIPKDSTAKISDLLYPITVQGQRNIIISFSPGCKSNVYQYTLQKVQ